MKTASLHELKRALTDLDKTALLELCLRLTKYKKENKELLSYLVFEADDESAYIASVKELIRTEMKELNRSSVYLIKKSLRKILRSTNKFIKFSGHKQTEVELLLYYCSQLKDQRIPIRSSQQLSNMYEQQVLKIQKALSGLHEDLQYDYRQELEQL